MNTERILPKIKFVNWRDKWFSSSGNWAYSNRVWTVQTRTSAAALRMGRSRTSTSWYSCWKYSKSWKNWREIRNFDSRNFREEEWTIISRSQSTSVISSSSWTRRIAEPRLKIAAKYMGYAWFFGKRFLDGLHASNSTTCSGMLNSRDFSVTGNIPVQASTEKPVTESDRDHNQCWAKMA